MDAYNANVTSMTASIEAFQGDTLILGDMLELGEYSTAEHQHIVDLLKQKGYTSVYLVGNEFAKTDCDFYKYSSAEQLRLSLALHPLSGRTILLKGSHGIHLEKLIEVL